MSAWGFFATWEDVVLCEGTREPFLYDLQPYLSCQIKKKRLKELPKLILVRKNILFLEVL